MLDSQLDKTINQLYRYAHRHRHEMLTLEHLMLGLLDNQHAKQILQTLGADMVLLRTELDDLINRHATLATTENEQEVQPTLAFRRVIQRAIYSAQSAEVAEVSGDRVLVAMFEERQSHVVYLLEKQGITRFEVVRTIAHNESAETPPDNDPQADKSSEQQKQATAADFLSDLNAKAKKDQIDPLIGREQEISRVIQVLMRRSKNNPLLIGEPGVGKTAIAEGLALKIVQAEVPEVMQDASVFTLDLGALLAGSKYRGDFEKRLKSVVRRIKNIPHAVLFIDEIHTIIGAGSVSGGSMDASNLLKPVLDAGELRCIGATTQEEARNIFDKDRALARRFQKITIKEPSQAEAIDILKGLQSRFEAFHKVRYSEQAIIDAVKLSAKHITAKHLPDKAIDVIDEAGAKQNINRHNEQTIDSKQIRRIVADIAKIPLSDLEQEDIERLQSIDRNLKHVIFGQDQAIDSLTTAIKMSRAGLTRDHRTIANLMFSGPTGVGKTEVVRQLSHHLNLPLLRFDMSEFMEAHTVAKMIGAPPGYVGYEQGGQLTDKVHQTPHCIVLLDEIEKAHPDVLNILLQVMDNGKLTDSNGRETDFRNVLLVMTTNAGAAAHSKSSFGFTEQDHSSDAMLDLERFFSPEFRNRLDAIIPFRSLTPEHVEKIVDKIIIELEQQLADNPINFELSQAARSWLVEKGYNKAMGARPMHRAIDQHIKKPLIDEILFGKLKHGGLVKISLQADQLQFAIQAATEPQTKTTTDSSITIE